MKPPIKKIRGSLWFKNIGEPFCQENNLQKWKNKNLNFWEFAKILYLKICFRKLKSKDSIWKLFKEAERKNLSDKDRVWSCRLKRLKNQVLSKKCSIKEENGLRSSCKCINLLMCPERLNNSTSKKMIKLRKNKHLNLRQTKPSKEKIMVKEIRKMRCKNS